MAEISRDQRSKINDLIEVVCLFDSFRHAVNMIILIEEQPGGGEAQTLDIGFRGMPWIDLFRISGYTAGD